MKVLYKTFRLLLLICVFLFGTSNAQSLDQITTQQTEEWVEITWEDFSQSGYYRIAYDYYLEQDTTLTSYLFSSEITDKTSLTLTELEEWIDYILEVQSLDVLGDATGEKTQSTILRVEAENIDFTFTEDEITTQTPEQLTLFFSNTPAQIPTEMIHIRSNKDATLLRIVHIQNKEDTAIIYISEDTPIQHDTSYTLSFIGNITDTDGQIFIGDSQYDFVSFIPVLTRDSWLENEFDGQKESSEKQAEQIDRLPDTGGPIFLFILLFGGIMGVYIAVKMSREMS